MPSKKSEKRELRDNIIRGIINDCMKQEGKADAVRILTDLTTTTKEYYTLPCSIKNNNNFCDICLRLLIPHRDILFDIEYSKNIFSMII